MSAADFLKDSLLAANNVALTGLRSGLEIGRRESEARIAELEAALRLILPMAKGYAIEHPVGNNMGMIANAHRVLAGAEREAT